MTDMTTHSIENLALDTDPSLPEEEVAYQVINELDEHSPALIRDVIDALALDDQLAERTFIGASEAFVKGLHAGEWITRNPRHRSGR